MQLSHAHVQSVANDSHAGGVDGKQPPMRQLTLSVEKQSTHSYEYKSSVKTNSSHRDAGSIIDNLQALNINI